MVKIYQVDAFTDVPFKGNPAAVCILDRTYSDDWMKSVANEMNLSETAFVILRENGYELRWFTPKVEMDLCGHATLATAHILWTEGYVDKCTELSFNTRSGVLKAKNLNGSIQLDFPALEYKQTKAPKELIQALGINPIYEGMSKENYLIEVDSENEVKALKPDFNLLAQVDMHGVIVTSKGDNEYDFVSRFFAPSVGVLEDPVTGSIQCVLVKYWKEKLKKSRFTAYQHSERGGKLRLELVDGRTLIIGDAVTVLRGNLGTVLELNFNKL